MNRYRALPPLLLTLAVAASSTLSAPAQGAQSFEGCTGFITALPATIATQGVWCLNQDLSTAIATGNAITVSANNVIIDCNDFKLGGLAAGIATQTIGIRSENRRNLTVRNCNMRGFFGGIRIDGEGSNGHVINNNRFEANTYGAIGVNGSGSTIRGNLVLDTGGSPLQNEAVAIAAYGEIDVIDNTIDGVHPFEGADGSGYGIALASMGGGGISGNRIRNIGFSGEGGYAGINAGFSGPVIIADNQLVGNGALAGSGSFGIYCSNEAVRVRDNSINGFPFAMVSCGDGGGNDVYGEFSPP